MNLSPSCLPRIYRVTNLLSKNLISGSLSTCKYSQKPEATEEEVETPKTSKRPQSKRMAEFRKKLKATPAEDLQSPEFIRPRKEDPLPPWPNETNPHTGEVGGPRGPEPTRYGDWERRGICVDF